MLLKKRYDYLCQAKFDKVKDVENKLTMVKNEHFEKIIVPNTYYCTFMEGKG